MNDIAKAKVFYTSILDLELSESEMGPNKMAWFPMGMNAAGAAGTLIQGEGQRR